MKASGGVTRPIDKNGRVVIPKEIRDQFDLKDDDPLEITVEGDRISLRKPVRSCALCGKRTKLIPVADKLICQDCVALVKAL